MFTSDNNTVNQVVKFENTGVKGSNQTLIVGAVMGVGNLPFGLNQQAFQHKQYTHNSIASVGVRHHSGCNINFDIQVSITTTSEAHKIIWYA